MELEEFKQIWAQYDRKLNKSLKINEELLREMNLDKYSHALKKPYYLEILNIGIQSSTMIVVTIFSIRVIGELQYSLPGLAGALLSMISMIFSFITARRLEELFTCHSNIVEHQRELLSLKAFILRVRRIAYMIAPLLGLLIVPVFVKMIGDVNIYDKPEYWILICFSIVGGLVLGTWLNIGIYDKGIKEAEMFLREIDEFEKGE